MTVNVLGRRLPATATYVIALAATLLLLVLTVSVALFQSNVSTDLNQAVRDSIERRAHYRIVLQRATDAETAQRGFMLTGDSRYLSPLYGARADAEQHLALLEQSPQLSETAAAELPRIREILGLKFAELERTIELSRAGERRAALAIVATDRGRDLMDELRTIVEGALDREGRVVTAQTAEVDSGNRRLRVIIIVSGVLIVLIGALLFYAVRNAMRELRSSRDEARAAHARIVDEAELRRSAEETVRQLQKMEAIGQITGGVAHDFNNMLAVITSALQLARRRLLRGDEGADTFIEAALDGARRAATLTSRLLAFARRSPLSPAVLDVNRVLGDMSQMLRRTLGEQIDLETVLAGGLWRVNADRHELEQAILNICVNARDAMPDGGKLTIESANAYLDEAYAGSNIDVEAGQYVLIAITDTGAGMDAAARARAFEPFFTTKEVGKGTGLGLSQVHGFLKQSGGHAAIYSELGHGTTVKLYLPRTHLAESAPAPQAQPVEEYAGDGATIILVVEDEERVRSLSVAALREIGYTVVHASCGAEALQMLDAHPGIALLFTDVVMPEMSGRVLAQQALERHPELKVLFATGYTQNAIVHNGVLDADARLILKPYSLSDLARKVRAVLDE